MKVLLILVILAIFMTSCNAQCYFIPKDVSVMPHYGECREEDGTSHELNSSWETEKCEKCFCIPSGIQCCNKVPVPVHYDKSKCKKIFHQENCTYSVVERDDPEKKCVVHSWVL